MTREEAVKLLQATRLMLMGGANQPISDLYYALDMAIEALEQIEPQTEGIKLGKWYSFNDYVVEMQGEGKPKEFRVIPMEKYLDTTDESLTFCKQTERSE